jgi:hypothetical protein
MRVRRSESETASHLPEPSIWPFVLGAASLLIGFAFVWWSHDRNGQWAGILAGMAGMGVAAGIAGWAWQDSHMRRQAALTERADRVGQTIEFKMVHAEAAAADLISAIERLGSELSGSAELEDLRILQSREDGRVFVLLETTWMSAAALEAFEATGRTFLDLLGQHAEIVEPGSVQVFDVDVLADSKDMMPRFNFAAASSILAAFVVGTIAFAAGLAAFSGEPERPAPPSPGRTPTPPAAFNGTIESRQIRFVQTRFSLPPNADITLVMDNQDRGVPHNIAFYQSETPGEGGFLGDCITGCDSGGSVLRTAIEPGLVTQVFTFKTPGVGKYGYLCEVHPITMRGVMEIVEGAMPPMVMP